MSWERTHRTEVRRKAPSVWSLAEAALFISNMQQAAYEAGYHLCLAGGVLNNGYSEHDLDVVAVPVRKGRAKPALDQWLYHAGYARSSFTGRPHLGIIQQWKNSDGRTIDIQFLGKP